MCSKKCSFVLISSSLENEFFRISCSKIVYFSILLKQNFSKCLLLFKNNYIRYKCSIKRIYQKSNYFKCATIFKLKFIQRNFDI